MRIAVEGPDGWVVYKPTESGGRVDLVLGDEDFTRASGPFFFTREDVAVLLAVGLADLIEDNLLPEADRDAPMYDDDPLLPSPED